MPARTQAQSRPRLVVGHRRGGTAGALALCLALAGGALPVAGVVGAALTAGPAQAQNRQA